MLYIPVNNFSVKSWDEPALTTEIKCLAQQHNTVQTMDFLTCDLLATGPPLSYCRHSCDLSQTNTKPKKVSVGQVRSQIGLSGLLPSLIMVHALSK